MSKPEKPNQTKVQDAYLDRQMTPEPAKSRRRGEDKPRDLTSSRTGLKYETR